jgi:hypothetical protein
VSGQGSVGPCSVCGAEIEADAAFVNIGPTDPHDPDRPKSTRYVCPGTDIHGWTPFVVAHPSCFAQVEGSAALHTLIESAGCE